PRAARAAHLPIERYKLYVFVISGVLAAVAGIVDFSLISSVSPTAGSTLLFAVLATVIIGGASLSGGRGTIVGTLVGVFLLEVLTNGLGLLGAGAYAQLLFEGGVILVAVAVDRWTNRSRATVEL
ncbi:MAG TPA: ribose ABC transporter permease, partial [Acetobacteraceae bacterium]|nr:ribose ABC transporter permease [Acetobacteraceae bacterium]